MCRCSIYRYIEVFFLLQIDVMIVLNGYRSCVNGFYKEIKTSHARSDKNIISEFTAITHYIYLFCYNSL